MSFPLIINDLGHREGDIHYTNYTLHIMWLEGEDHVSFSI